jgi:hypothetical protein
MTDTVDDIKQPWNASAVSKARNAVQREVAALVDDLVPDRALGRSEKPADAIERYRTPTGCVLQGADRAVSISWFANATDDVTFGELHILHWQGRVARRGGTGARGESATVISDIVFHPSDTTKDHVRWRSANGEPVDRQELAQKCLALLEG